MAGDIDVAEYIDADREGLAEMYEHWDPTQSSQGIPPAGRAPRVKWLTLLLDRGINAVARSGGEIIGHAVLMPDLVGSWELAVFVRRDAQHAGIGTALTEMLLDRARTLGIDDVWISVESSGPAASCAARRGFHTDVDDGWQQIRRVRPSTAGQGGI